MKKKEFEALQSIVESLVTREFRLEDLAKRARDELLYVEHQARRAGIAEARAALEGVLKECQLPRSEVRGLREQACSLIVLRLLHRKTYLWKTENKLVS